MISHDVVLPFKNKGEPCGFNACPDKEFVFKPDKYCAVIIPLENLKNNLRVLVRAKLATIVKTKDVEAVVVPAKYTHRLFI